MPRAGVGEPQSNRCLGRPCRLAGDKGLQHPHCPAAAGGPRAGRGVARVVPLRRGQPGRTGRFDRAAYRRRNQIERLILKVRATDHFRGHAGTAEQNRDRCDLEWSPGEALWDECRANVLDAGRHAGWDDPEVRQSAHDLYDASLANARRAMERDDCGRLSVPAAAAGRPPAEAPGLSAGSTLDARRSTLDARRSA